MPVGCSHRGAHVTAGACDKVGSGWHAMSQSGTPKMRRKFLIVSDTSQLEARFRGPYRKATFPIPNWTCLEWYPCGLPVNNGTDCVVWVEVASSIPRRLGFACPFAVTTIGV
uniref:Uncharacterized protein n=1 Tax=Physcomitrium patens TaxID=3218 RepID=A0A2K1KCC4_PHYPA|nr:hypothetical protein PHYPA_010615 [Physcomitrium patens]